MEVAKEANLTLPASEEFERDAGQGRHRDGQRLPNPRRPRDVPGRERDRREATSTIPRLHEEQGFSTLYVAKDNAASAGSAWRTTPGPRRAGHRGSWRTWASNASPWSPATAGGRQPRRGRDGLHRLQAECLPQDKLAVVEQIKKDGHTVAVVGDGVNDAPALAAGDLGIAMGAAGSDVAINSASIALMNNDLRRMPFLVDVSRKTRRVINQNLRSASSFIVLGISLSKFVPPGSGRVPALRQLAGGRLQQRPARPLRRGA